MIFWIALGSNPSCFKKGSDSFFETMMNTIAWLFMASTYGHK